MVCIEPAVARIYSWKDWVEVESVSLAFDMTGLQLKSLLPYNSSQISWNLVELSGLDGPSITRRVHFLDAEAFGIKDPTRSEYTMKATKIQETGGNLRKL